MAVTFRGERGTAENANFEPERTRPRTRWHGGIDVLEDVGSPRRRVGPSVPDIAPRPRVCPGVLLQRDPSFSFGSPLAVTRQSAKPGVHYTQLDARVAPRYVRQTGPPFAWPSRQVAPRIVEHFPSRFSPRLLSRGGGGEISSFSLSLFLSFCYLGESWEIDSVLGFLHHRKEHWMNMDRHNSLALQNRFKPPVIIHMWLRNEENHLVVFYYQINREQLLSREFATISFHILMLSNNYIINLIHKN